MACNKNKRFSVPFVVVFGTNEMIKFKLIKPFDNFIKAEEKRKTNVSGSSSMQMLLKLKKETRFVGN